MTRLEKACSICAAVSAVFALSTNVALAGKPGGKTASNWVVTMTEIGPLVPGGESAAYSINELGEIVGTATNAQGIRVRPIWKDGAVIGFLEGVDGAPYTWNSNREAVGANIVNSKIGCSVYWIPGGSGQLPPLPGGDSCATYGYDVNEHGEMAGGAQGFDGTVRQSRPVTWKNGAVFRDLGMPPGAVRAVGSGINDQGDVVGHMTDASGKIDAFLYRNGQYTKLQPLTERFATYAIDINNNGDVLGTSDGGVPVVWKAGAAAPAVLPIPTGRYPHSVWHINDSGDVVGTVSAAPPAFYTAVLWRNGEFIELGQLPGGSESYARGINNAGTVVGVSTMDPPYSWRAVVWTVAPKQGGGKPPRGR